MGLQTFSKNDLVWAEMVTDRRQELGRNSLSLACVLFALSLHILMAGWGLCRLMMGEKWDGVRELAFNRQCLTYIMRHFDTDIVEIGHNVDWNCVCSVLLTVGHDTTWQQLDKDGKQARGKQHKHCSVIDTSQLSLKSASLSLSRNKLGMTKTLLMFSVKSSMKFPYEHRGKYIFNNNNK